MNIPFNIAAGNSSGYNYASGRLDHQTYYKALKVDRSHIEEVILDRILEVWLFEWRLVRRRALGRCEFRHVWFWDGQEHVDPQKEANAQSVRLQSRTTSLASEYAKQGKDWETELRQIAREKELMEKLGIAPDEPEAQEEEKEDE